MIYLLQSNGSFPLGQGDPKQSLESICQSHRHCDHDHGLDDLHDLVLWHHGLFQIHFVLLQERQPNQIQIRTISKLSNGWMDNPCLSFIYSIVTHHFLLLLLLFFLTNNFAIEKKWMMQFNDSGKTSVADILKDNSKLTPDAVNAIVTDIMENKLSNTEIGAFLAAVKLLGKENDARVIFAAAEALRAASLKCGMTSKVIDIVGTGGDGQDTFNVSTAASIVASGTGCKVAKHGSRASSSSSGSADVLEALGAELDAVNPQTASYILQSSNFCFLFAPSFHPAMKNVAEARKELGVRTLFNM